MHLKDIDIELVDIDEPFKFRLNPQDKSLTDLKTSLEIHGQLHPVIVREKHDGRFNLICGCRRVLAAKQAGMRTLTAIVYTHIQQEDALRVFIIENLHRKKISPLDISLICHQLKTRTNASYEQIGKTLNLKPKTIQRYLKLQSLSEKTKDALKNNQIGFRHAVLLAQVDDAVQSKLVNETIKEKLSTRELEHRIKGETKEYCLSIKFSIENWKEELTSKITEILESITSGNKQS